MNKLIYYIRIAFQATIIAGIYMIYCSNPDGTFSLRMSLFLIWLVVSLASQFYLMKFPAFYPVSPAVTREKGEHLAEVNLFLAIGLLIIYDLLGPLVAIAFYLWDRRLTETQS